jgi:radical SAM protein with 4Fe4S-binding SPASM domain
MELSHPYSIEIEINSHCNLACSYCPNSISERIEKGTMDFVLFQKILSQLSERNYRGKIAFDFFNEPMLAKNFDQFVRATREALPESPIELYTNGTLINSEERAKELVNNGISKVVVTKHEEVQELKFQKVYDQLDLEIKDRFTIKDFRDLTLTNRGGLLENTGENVTANLPCQIPSIMMSVTVKGNVLACFEDYNQTLVMGNVSEEHILDIWENEKFCQFRESLFKGERNQHEICKNCNRISENMRPNKNQDRHFLGEEEVEAVRRVIESKKLFRYQPIKSECLLFEEEFCQKTGSPYAFLCTSGTNALILAMAAEGIGPGDEVIIPSYTFVATANAVTNLGAIPIIANVDEQLGLCPRDVEQKISENTKAIIPVHMDGLLADLTSLLALANKHQLVLIEDAAQCLGGRFENSYAGTLGDYGCFSLNMDKVLTAGEGGIIVTKSRVQYERLCLLSDGAFSFSPHHKEFFQEIQHPFLGYSMRVSEFTGAMMREQLKKWDHILSEFRIRKNIIAEEVNQAEAFQVLRGHSPGGEACVAVHLACSGPDITMLAGKKLRDSGVIAAPVTLRPAHVSWKWSKILEAKTGRKYPKVDVLESVNRIMSVLRIEIEINWSIEETQKIARRICEVSREVSN